MSLSASSYNKSTASVNNFTFQAVSINEKPDANSMNFLDWIIGNDFIHLEGQSVYGQSTKRIQEIYFSLSGSSAVYYPLLRGIIASGQPDFLLLEANHQSRRFTFRFETQKKGEARKYLSKVFRIIRKEIRFKQVLRKVILNQEKFLLEEKLLFNEMSK